MTTATKIPDLKFRVDLSFSTRECGRYDGTSLRRVLNWIVQNSRALPGSGHQDALNEKRRLSRDEITRSQDP